MKRILLLVLFVTTIAQSQTKKRFETQVKIISQVMDKITKKHKDSLKQQVKEINVKLADKKISFDEAIKLKNKAATYHALQIENKIAIQEQKLQQLVQDKIDGKILSSDVDSEKNSFKIGGATFKLDFSKNEETKKKRRKDKRTTTQIVVAMGVNNVLDNYKLGSLNDSDYKFWQSHFYEVGFTWKTRFSKKPSKTYLKYGFSFLWNNLRAQNNQYHQINGNETSLITHPNQLSESRLRHVQMTFPMHLEFDLSKNKVYTDKQVRDRTHRSIRFGVGGFVGFKLGTRQYLEFKNPTGVTVEEVQKNSFNTNTLNYGLSAYFAYKSCGLYAKYDLNPLFKNTETRNISLGLRFDID